MNVAKPPPAVVSARSATTSAIDTTAIMSAYSTTCAPSSSFANARMDLLKELRSCFIGDLSKMVMYSNRYNYAGCCINFLDYSLPCTTSDIHFGLACCYLHD